MKHFLFTVLATLLLLITQAKAVTVTYIGSNGGSWSLDSNWDTGTKPTSGDDVVIPSDKFVRIPSGFSAYARSVDTGFNSTLEVGDGVGVSQLSVDGSSSTVGIFNRGLLHLKSNSRINIDYAGPHGLENVGTVTVEANSTLDITFIQGAQCIGLFNRATLTNHGTINIQDIYETEYWGLANTSIVDNYGDIILSAMSWGGGGVYLTGEVLRNYGADVVFNNYSDARILINQCDARITINNTVSATFNNEGDIEIIYGLADICINNIWMSKFNHNNGYIDIIDVLGDDSNSKGIFNDATFTNNSFIYIADLIGIGIENRKLFENKNLVNLFDIESIALVNKGSDALFDNTASGTLQIDQTNVLNTVGIHNFDQAHFKTAKTINIDKINGSLSKSILNEYLMTNTGTIRIRDCYQGINNTDDGVINNHNIIEIDNLHIGILNEGTGIINNHDMIKIFDGGASGIINNAEFNNLTNSIIDIDDLTELGIENTAVFTNYSDIQINNIQGRGIFNNGVSTGSLVFKNLGNISMTQLINPDPLNHYGLLADGIFENMLGATLLIEP